LLSNFGLTKSDTENQNRVVKDFSKHRIQIGEFLKLRAQHYANLVFMLLLTFRGLAQ